MSKGKILLIITIVVLLIAFVIWPGGPIQNMLRNKDLNKLKDEVNDGNGATVPPAGASNINGSTGTTTPAANTVLKQGTTDTARLAKLKRLINAHFDIRGKAQPLTETDKNFGPSTESNLKTAFGVTQLTAAKLDSWWDDYANNYRLPSSVAESFPLVIGNYGPKTYALNKALGQLTANKYNYNVSKDTLNRFNAKLGTNWTSISETYYNQIVKGNTASSTFFIPTPFGIINF